MAITEQVQKTPAQAAREAHWKAFNERFRDDVKGFVEASRSYMPVPPLTEEEKARLTPDDLVGVARVQTQYGETIIVGEIITELFGGPVEEMYYLCRHHRHNQQIENWEALTADLARQFKETTGFSVEEVSAAIYKKRQEVDPS
ncbi:MAG: hypothetical protein UY16_C0052G0004 [Candidatus Gottesmanbacteria bacterium GW2011_GWA2_47_9]|nr:MAG: hypothetical protein UY01_C0038G0005 [Candidatus Nomurabacteria bacterium GW2011_GWB1_47_6]KKU86595.1 MAG: hypothetical protein UY16_C0052G0004 [Candidatus Gottesmanbacteria bacterium GW2011_GWA2_47_9]